MGIRGHGRPGPRPKKTDPIISAVVPEVVQTPAVSQALCEPHGVADCFKCKEAARKRQHRAIERAKEEFKGVETIQDFWAVNLRMRTR